ncbi:MAG: hypothetical protein HY217_05155 [Candidatus Rokubacteria bacterium]|nr:hypothetical protein [Candidatus Rokubacteria bacterium]
MGRETVARAGSDVTVVAVSQMVGEARKAGHTLAAQGIGVEVIDPR